MIKNTLIKLFVSYYQDYFKCNHDFFNKNIKSEQIKNDAELFSMKLEEYPIQNVFLILLIVLAPDMMCNNIQKGVLSRIFEGE